MSFYMTTVVYENNPPDEECVVCARKSRDGKTGMQVGYFGEEASELNKIVTKQGYLKEHDDNIKNVLLDDLMNLVKKESFYPNIETDLQVIDIKDIIKFCKEKQK